MADISMMDDIERGVCAAVNKVFDTLRPGAEKSVPGTLYGRKGRVPMAMNEARRFCVLVMKDFLHLSSAEIGRRTGLTTGAVKKILRKARYDSMHDALSFAIYNEIRNMFTGGAKDGQ